MNNRKYTFIGLTFLVVITAITTLLLSSAWSLLITGSLGGYSSDDVAFIRKLMLSKNVLKDNYYGDISDEKIYDGALQGMFSSTGDPYTAYLPAQENEQLEELTIGKYQGIGVYVSMLTDSSIIVVGVLPASPAESAGIQAFDKIISVNGTVCAGQELDNVVKMMKVVAGTELNIVLERDGKIIEKKITTNEIKIQMVSSQKIDDIGYIDILSFGENTFEEFKTEYDKLRSENIKGLIVDVRDNGGGVFDEAVEIAQLLVPSGTIVYTEDKNGKRTEEKSNGTGIDIPLVVLVNEESASASEILAGAIKDRKVGTLVGKKTFGKGVMQGWYLMGDGTSVKLTIAKYFTPNNICIDGIGIEPDVEVELGSYKNDLQMKKALEILKK